MKTETNSRSAQCFCGSHKAYEACCELYISGKQLAPNPEALMRSRFTAYTQADINYIVRTMMGPAAKDFNITNALHWAQEVSWLGLEVVKVSPLTNSGKLGFVEYIASFRLHGQVQKLHEVSEFHLENGAWFYFDGKILTR